MATVDLSQTAVDRTSRERAGLGIIPLSGLVAGSMIGAGVFSLPQNLTSAAGPLATLIAWTITGVGMLGLAHVFQSLAARRPDLDAGPYLIGAASFPPAPRSRSWRHV